MNRREFLHVLATAATAGFALDARATDAKRDADAFYALPRFGNVHLLHFTDCHAQLLPAYFREPNVNLGIGVAKGRPPHLVGEALLKRFGIKPGTGEAYAFTCLDFAHAARLYGRLGGFAQLATLIKRLKADRPGALVLDGGDTWQGSATALWTKGQDMVEAAKLLGVDVMTAHWEFTYGAERVKELIARELAGRIDFVAQNVRTADFGDAVFPAYALREVNGRSRLSARRFPTRRSRIRAASSPTGASAFANRSCNRSSTKCAGRRRKSSCFYRTTAWMSTSS